MKQKIQLIEKEVKNKFQVVDISETLDEGFEKLIGISVPDKVGLDNLLLNSSLDGTELFPKNFEMWNVQSSKNVPPDLRFYTLHDLPAKGKKIQIQFRDGGTAPQYPYILKIQLRLEK